ncbi:hypothetical protein ACTFIZ_002831 [Dictyostelium cf. discoideum]
MRSRHPGTAQAKPLVSQSLQQQNRVAHWRDTSSNGKEAGASGPAAWERTQSIISKTLRIKSKQRSEEQNKLDSLISQKILQFSRQWNSPLHSIKLPKHLKIYNNSLSSLYK